MILYQLIFKLECLQTAPAEAVGVFAFYIYSFFMTQFRATALAGGNIAHFALKWFGASRAMFYFMFVCHSNQSNVK
jgi:hypothetical protein